MITSLLKSICVLIAIVFFSSCDVFVLKELPQNKILLSVAENVVRAKKPSYALYMVNPDGTGLKKLMNYKVGATNSRWSPNNRSIVYADIGQSYRLEILDFQSLNRSHIRYKGDALPDATTETISWSKDSDKLVYNAEDVRYDDGHVNLGIVINDLKHKTKIKLPAYDTEGKSFRGHQWSPVKDEIAFIQLDQKEPSVDLFLMDATGKNWERITFGSQIRWLDNFLWSRDGQYLYFEQTIENDYKRWGVFRVHVKSKQIEIVIEDLSVYPRVYPELVAFSPDGSELLFNGVGAFYRYHLASNIMHKVELKEFRTTEGTSPRDYFGATDWSN